jgi:hypothetical protein
MLRLNCTGYVDENNIIPIANEETSKEHLTGITHVTRQIPQVSKQYNTLAYISAHNYIYTTICKCQKMWLLVACPFHISSIIINNDKCHIRFRIDNFPSCHHFDGSSTMVHSVSYKMGIVIILSGDKVVGTRS